MASLRAALLVLLPPLSVVVVAMAARWLCRVMAQSLQLACCLPSGGPPSFRYLLLVSSSSSSDIVSKGGGGVVELPVALYSRRTTTRRRRSCVGEEEEEECVFCLSGIEEGSEVRELRCRHVFHRACLDRWVRARPGAARCPLCRGRLLLEEAAVEDSDSESESDMMLFMACVVQSRSSTWLWPSWS